MFIPGFLIAWVTFPGVVVHEFAHQLFCYLYKIPVYKVCYFRFGNPAGYVIHGPARKPWHSVMVAIGPFFINTMVGALIAFPVVISIYRFHAFDFLGVIIAWLGLSITMHAFPSTGDAQAIMSIVKQQGVPLHTKAWAYPVVGLIYIGAVGSFFWLDLMYGILVAGILPNLIVKAMA